jgi:hypothetical protein
VRRDLIELFVFQAENNSAANANATSETVEVLDEESNKKRKTSSSSSITPNKTNTVFNEPVSTEKTCLYHGRVGFRCIHCAKHSGPKDSRSTVYPSFLAGIYCDVSAWQRVHFQICRYVPQDIRKRYEHYKVMDTSKAKVKHWESSAKKIGLVDNPDVSRDGVVLA